jgi:hypothetical protein
LHLVLHYARGHEQQSVQVFWSILWLANDLPNPGGHNKDQIGICKFGQKLRLVWRFSLLCCQLS